MIFQKIYIKSDTLFGKYMSDWAAKLNIEVEAYDTRLEDHYAEGLLLITANQDIDKELYEVHNQFAMRHIPTQKIDVNGTLQVAISSLDLWLKNNKCSKVLVLGSDKLVQNENLDRYFNRVEAVIA